MLKVGVQYIQIVFNVSISAWVQNIQIKCLKYKWLVKSFSTIHSSEVFNIWVTALVQNIQVKCLKYKWLVKSSSTSNQVFNVWVSTWVQHTNEVFKVPHTDFRY